MANKKKTSFARLLGESAARADLERSTVIRDDMLEGYAFALFPEAGDWVNSADPTHRVPWDTIRKEWCRGYRGWLRICPKNSLSWPHGPAQEPHPCPYRSDISGDNETLCRCCSRCTMECAADI